MNSLPVDRPARVGSLCQWHQSGLIDEATFFALMGRLRSVREWRRWGGRALLAVGTVLLLAGIVFFFAWNWAGMERWQRLALPMAGAALPALGSLMFRPGDLRGTMALFAASIMVGVFLAVFGQEYQTGADAYGLFVGWALLSIPWVLAAKFTPLLALWLLILSTGIVLWWEQAGGGIFRSDAWRFCLLSVTGLHLAASLIAEALRGRVGWLRPSWFRLWLLGAALVPLTTAVCLQILFDFVRGDALISATWLVVVVGAFWFYRRGVLDAAAAALSAGCGAAVLLCGAARLLWTVMRAVENSPGVLLGLLIYCGVLGMMIAGTVWALRRLAIEIHREVEAGSGPQPAGEGARDAGAGKSPAAGDWPTWRQLLAEVEISGPKRSELEGRIGRLAASWAEPAWLKVAAAVGAWVAALTFFPAILSTLFIFGADRNPALLMIVGGLLLAGCCALSHRVGDSTFTRQLNLAVAIGAVGLIQSDFFVDGYASSLVATALLGVIALATYPFFKDGAYRFVICMMFLGMLTLHILTFSEGRQVWFPALIGLVGVAAALLWAWRSRPRALNPLAQALALGLGGLVIVQTSIYEFGWMGRTGRQSGFHVWLLGAGVVFMICALNRGLRSLTSQWGIAMAILCAGLAALGQAGLLVALLIAVAGHAWGDRLLSALSWLFLGGYLFFFYHSLNTPLSMKAAIIGGTGLALLAAWKVLAPREGEEVRA